MGEGDLPMPVSITADQMRWFPSFVVLSHNYSKMQDLSSRHFFYHFVLSYSKGLGEHEKKAP